MIDCTVHILEDTNCILEDTDHTLVDGEEILRAEVIHTHEDHKEIPRLSSPGDAP
jgi:hypothetical protein